MTTMTTEITFTVKITTNADGHQHIVHQDVLPDLFQQAMPEIWRRAQPSFRPAPPPQCKSSRRHTVTTSTPTPSSRKSFRHSANISALRSPPENPSRVQTSVPSFAVTPPTPRNRSATTDSNFVEPPRKHLDQQLAFKASVCACSGISSVLQTHHSVFKASLPSARQAALASNRARDKLRHLLLGQFYELSTDCYEELLRRNIDPSRPTLDLPSTSGRMADRMSPKLQAKQKLSGLSDERFKGLIRDMTYDLERRFPAFTA